MKEYNIKLTCTHCDNQFIINKKQFERKSQGGQTNFYCSPQCRHKSKRIDLTCDNCGKLYTRIKSKWNGRKNKKNLYKACSASCRQKLFISFNRKKPRKIDKYTPFVLPLKFVRGRKKKHIINITLQDIYNLYIKQNGKCAYTGLKMDLYKCRQEKTEHTPYLVSIDRINSNESYTKDNIQLVCLFVNYGKNNFSDEQTKRFISDIKK